MVLVIVLITALGVMTSTYLQGRDQLKAMNRLGNYIALSVSHNSELGILSEEPSNLEQPLTAAMGERQVMGVSVYLANGKLISSKKRRQYLLNDFEITEQLALLNSTPAPAVAIETQTTRGRSLRSYLAKVIIEKSDDDVFNIEAEQEQFHGSVRVDMSLAQLAAKKAAILYQNLLLMPIYILIGIAFSMLLERRISKPLMRLKVAAGAVAKGDFSTRLKAQSEDELGLLAESFNNMSRQLSGTINELNYANNRLEKANKELQDFTYIVSHDLQEPLRKVHSFGQFLMEDCNEQLPEDGKDYIHRMQKATVKMKGLIQDLLKLSRVGTAEKSSATASSAEVVASALDDLSIVIQESGADIEVGQLPNVVVDHTLLTQLFENLISNALKYRNDDRKPKIEIGASEQNGQVRFSVKDNGIGIEERFLEKIFGVFQRLHARDEKYKGTGIGLAFCKKIVEKYGGEIWAESTAGQGSTFYFTMKKAY